MINEVRRKNIRLLVEQYGGQSGLAKATGKAPAYINQLVSGTRNLGESACRSFEAELGLPKGWFDTAHTPADADAPFPTEIWKTFSPQTRALVLWVVEFLQINGSPASEEEAQLLQCFRACTTEARAVVLSVAAAQARQRRSKPPTV